MIALVNLNHIRNTFIPRNLDRELIEFGECTTARELEERYPETYHREFDWLFKYELEGDTNLKEMFYDSETFYTGYYASMLENR